MIGDGDGPGRDHENHTDGRAADSSVPTDGPNLDDSVGVPEEQEFGWPGWLLVGSLFVAFLVVPGLIYFRPPGVSFTFAYLVLPLVPAVLLALLAVWVATRT